MNRVAYLVVRANGEVRVTKRRPTLAADEVGMALNITMPDGWGRVVGSVDVTMPEPPHVTNTGQDLAPDEAVDNRG
jgi:hypothetical protein